MGIVLDNQHGVWHRLWAETTTRGAAVRDESRLGFGILIAYVLPGFTVLASLATVSDPLVVWLFGPQAGAPAVGGVLYVTAASVLIGMLLNVIRWATLDWLCARTGIERPDWNDARLAERLEAFQSIVENHHRYYQFYGNMAIALPLSLIAVRFSEHAVGVPIGVLEGPAILIEAVLIAGSRDALRRYFSRTASILSMEESTMTNGHHPKGEAAKPESKTKAVKATAGSEKPAAKK